MVMEKKMIKINSVKAIKIIKEKKLSKLRESYEKIDKFDKSRDVEFMECRDQIKGCSSIKNINKITIPK